MSDLFDKLSMLLKFSFVHYAIIAGTVIALCSSLLGVTLVLKRFSFIGDGLSHTAFGALCLASVLNITAKDYFVLPITILFAIFLLCGKKNSKVKGETSLALISTTSLAFGYLVMNIFKPKTNLSGDVCTTLFGSTKIITLSLPEVISSVILSGIVILLFILFYNKIFAVTFDEDFAKTSGTNVFIYNFVMAIFIGTIIVLAMNLVGSLLISALIIFPAISAMFLFKNFKSVTIFSAISSTICALLGILVSLLADTPVGSTIVAVDFILFVVCFILSKVLRGR